MLKRPIGAGKWERKCRMVNIASDRLKKTSVITVPADESQLCCAKVIVYALAVLEQNKKDNLLEKKDVIHQEK